MDQAEKGKMELETDPFLAAGIEIPQELSPCPGTPETSHKKLETQRSRVETEKPKSPLAETSIAMNESEPVLKQLKPLNSVEVIGEDEKAGLLDSTTSKPEKIV